jgi:hypothetical protein
MTETRPVRPREVRSLIDQERVVQQAAALTGWLCTAGHTLSRLVRLVDDDIEVGLRAASYDGVGGAGADPMSAPEAATLSADRAVDHHAKIRVGVALLAQALDHLGPVIDAYDPVLARPETTARRRPGQGPCPSGKCEDCWAAGLVRAAAAKRYARWCRRHGDHRRTFGASMPAPVTLAAEATRSTTTDGRIDWEHWRVVRAWSACGGRPRTPMEASTTSPAAAAAP